MTLDQWLRLTAIQLSDFSDSQPDQQHIHWPKDLLLSYYNDATAYIASLKPADHVTTVVIRLLPGSTQNTCCEFVGKVTEQVDSVGNFIANIRSIKTTPTWLGSTVCNTSNTYSPSATYRIDDAPASFAIWPPVPATGAYYVKIRCSQAPAPITSANLSVALPASKFSAAITEWALYRALSGETDTALMNAAALHYKAFFELLGLQNKAAAAFLPS
jgi:hypothetical protein